MPAKSMLAGSRPSCAVTATAEPSQPVAGPAHLAAASRGKSDTAGPNQQKQQRVWSRGHHVWRQKRAFCAWAHKSRVHDQTASRVNFSARLRFPEFRLPWKKLKLWPGFSLSTSDPDQVATCPSTIILHRNFIRSDEPDKMAPKSEYSYRALPRCCYDQG